jgi:hypothetical protein
METQIYDTNDHQKMARQCRAVFSSFILNIIYLSINHHVDDNVMKVHVS